MLAIEARNNGYNPKQCGRTMTVGEMIDWLEQFDENEKIYLRHDGGYTYGSINTMDFVEEEDDE